MNLHFQSCLQGIHNFVDEGGQGIEEWCFNSIGYGEERSQSLDHGCASLTIGFRYEAGLRSFLTLSS